MSSTEYNPSHFSGQTKGLCASGRQPAPAARAAFPAHASPAAWPVASPRSRQGAGPTPLPWESSFGERGVCPGIRPAWARQLRPVRDDRLQPAAPGLAREGCGGPEYGTHGFAGREKAGKAPATPSLVTLGWLGRAPRAPPKHPPRGWRNRIVGSTKQERGWSRAHGGWLGPAGLCRASPGHAHTPSSPLLLLGQGTRRKCVGFGFFGFFFFNFAQGMPS